ncbi:MAG TPA: VOC family protein [Jiangellaceae bacterium]|nr:VOC family protein [Jiangellaceae bacterium]
MTTTTVHFSAVGLVVADMTRSLAFYRRLGIDMPESEDTALHAEYALPGGLRLMWDTVDTVRSFDPDWQPPTGGPQIALAFDCTTPEGVDELYAELTADGYTGTQKPWDAFWGQRYSSVQDPDGNSVDLFAALPVSG